ncbi:hypothetical protein BVC80_557g6 [Macleaya cordata]|uniref:Uncharacterized protein n=1 Tax=Macleaya cordata TaxID=56857 RepID=A0A200R1F6_MACCD|nr:hypothetical protein BVC80_557g6 [Macleaya cordata]
MTKIKRSTRRLVCKCPWLATAYKNLGIVRLCCVIPDGAKLCSGLMEKSGFWDGVVKSSLIKLPNGFEGIQGSCGRAYKLSLLQQQRIDHGDFNKICPTLKKVFLIFETGQTPVGKCLRIMVDLRKNVKGLEMRNTIEDLNELKGMPSRGDVEIGEIPTLLDLGLNPNASRAQVCLGCEF